MASSNLAEPIGPRSNEPEYYIDSQPLSDSHLESLYLVTKVCGVLYHRDEEGQAAATVLLKVNFCIPRDAEMAYAKLPFSPRKAHQNDNLSLTINALTPDGEQIGCLSVRQVQSTTTMQPSVNISAAGIGLGLSGLGCTRSTTNDVHHHIELFGFCGLPNTSSYWEFKNEGHHRFPRQVFLLIEFSSDHNNDEPFPFILPFNSNCQLVLSKSLIRRGKKFIGQPGQKYDIKIKGNWKRKEVENHRSLADTGIIAPVERTRREAHPT